jgi:hypothetical protein
MTPETAKQQAVGALRDAGLAGQVRDIQSAAIRDRFEQEGRVIWDEPAIRVWMTVSEKAGDELVRKIQDALWTLDGVENGGYDGHSLISVIWWLEDDQDR